MQIDFNTFFDKVVTPDKDMEGFEKSESKQFNEGPFEEVLDEDEDEE